MGRKLGEGSNSVVYSVKNLAGVEFAAKRVRITENGLAEVDLMLRLNHPNIVKGVEFADINHELYLIQELGVPMDTLIDNLREKDKVRIVFGLGSALQYLQNNGVIHCDIKPDNIICVNGNYKFTDLGLAQFPIVNIALPRYIGLQSILLVKITIVEI